MQTNCMFDIGERTTQNILFQKGVITWNILLDNKIANIIQLLDETEQNIVIYQWRADKLFANAEGRGK